MMTKLKTTFETGDIITSNNNPLFIYKVVDETLFHGEQILCLQPIDREILRTDYDQIVVVIDDLSATKYEKVV